MSVSNAKTSNKRNKMYKKVGRSILIRIKKPPSTDISKFKPKHRKNTTFRCEACDYKAKDIKWLKNHVNKNHTQDKVYKCSQCNYTTSSKESYDMHGRTPHEKCEVCSLMATQYMLMRHKRKHGHGLKVYKCETCSFQTTEKRNMDRHERIVHVKDRYKCDKCDYATSQKSNYYSHKKIDHITCELCLFVTTNDRLLKRHKVSWHSSQNLVTDDNIPTQNEEAELPESFQESKSILSEHNESDNQTAGACKDDTVAANIIGVYWTPFKGLKSDEARDDTNFVGCSESDISHYKETHHKEDEMIRCEKCPVMFRSKEDLTNHMGAMHLLMPNIKKAHTQTEKTCKSHIRKQTTEHITSEGDKGSIVIKNTTSLQCEKCSFIGSNTQGLSTHVKAAHDLKPAILLCEFCYFVAIMKNTHANKYEEIVTHMKTIHPEKAKLNKCNLCDHIAYNRKLLVNHRDIAHLRETDRQCKNCDFCTVFKKEMSHHRKDVHNIPYNYLCKICGKDYINMSRLVTHKKSEHSSKILHNCVFCKFKAKSLPIIQKHTEVEHKKEDVNKSCQLCGFEVQDVKMIEEHMSEVHKKQSKMSTCEKCKFSAYHKPILDQHKAFHEKMICTLCPFAGKSRTGLQIHIKMKHSGKKIQCKTCNFSATSSQRMRKHEKDAHGTPYDFVCKICGKDFQVKSDLETHGLTHSDTKRLKCNLCTFETKQHPSIRIHWKYVHTDIKIEIKCQYCDFEAPKLSELTSFKHANEQLTMMEDHLMDVHLDTAKLRCCDKCQFATYHGPSLLAHQQSLHELKCELCNYEAETKKGLRIHTNISHIRKKKCI